MQSESTSPWRPADEPVSLGDPSRLAMIVDGPTFVLSTLNGDIGGDGALGFFVADRRVLSRFELYVNGEGVEGLAVHRGPGGHVLHIGRARSRAAHRSLLVMRHRVLEADVLSETIEIRNNGLDDEDCTISLRVGADLASLFAVKEARRPTHSVDCSVGRDFQLFRLSLPDIRRETRVVAMPPDDVMAAPGKFTWKARLEPYKSWTATVTVTTLVGSQRPNRRSVAERDSGMRPRLSTSNADFERLVHRALEDLESLRIPDPMGGPADVIAAGAPWFMTLFGRDSLITAYEALLFDPQLAWDVVQTLASLQGTDVDPVTEEEPGRIIHEIRFDQAGAYDYASAQAYYGSVDSTPLFVYLVGELARWGLASPAQLKAIVDNVDRALDWIKHFGDRDGDGYIEYESPTAHGLRNQGWKDSWDGIRYGSGAVANPPLAVCEAQAYVYAAYLARRDIARVLNDPATAMHYEREANALKRRFNEDFWMPERGTFAVALDGRKQQVDSVTSNVGHCLWTGIVDTVYARSAAGALLAPDLWTGWGVRTLGASTPGYDPLSYHCGSVWPHDTAIAATGLRRYGFADEAVMVVEGLVEMGRRFDYRLPELIAGLSRDEVGTPIRYPTSCIPQAWSAAAILQSVRVLLGFEPNTLDGVLGIAPRLPSWIDYLRIEGVTVLGDVVDVRATDDNISVRSLGGLRRDR